MIEISALPQEKANRGGGVPAVPQRDWRHLYSAGMQVWTQAWHSGSRTWRCCSCGAGHNWDSTLILRLGTPYAIRWSKKKKKKKAMGGSVLWTGRALNLAEAHKVHSMISHHRTSSMLSCMNKGIRIRSREVIQPLSLPLSFCWAIITWRVLVISRGYTFIVTHVVTGMMAPRE